MFNICDREADFYELFASRRTENVHLLVRSQYNRALKDEPQLKVQDKVGASGVRATFRVEVTEREGRTKRSATVELRFCRVHFEMANPSRFQKGLPPVTLWAVQVMEPAPPKGTKPVKWILLTSKKVESVVRAKCVVRYYALR